jgi:orotidine-5'-phosphate decarboxylase
MKGISTMTDYNDVPASERVIVALDCSRDRAYELANLLEGKATWLKIGMTLFYAEGPSIVTAFKKRGFKIFVDLKLHDIPHQVEGAARCITTLGADMLTVHAIGGVPMMEAAVRGITAGVNERNDGARPISLAVTVLTSMNEDMLAQTGVQRPLSQQVEALAYQAREAGLDGVVASPQEAALLRTVFGPNAAIVTPGVRLAGSPLDDQSRVTTPSVACAQGSSHIVVGRPIVEADDPVAAFASFIHDIER